MQEEVEKQACNLVVTVAKLTVQELMKKLNEYVAEKKADKAAIRRAKMLEPKHGKQSVKELIGQGQGVQSIDIEKAGLKDFQRIANRYGVDFAVVKDKAAEPPVYNVFFKGKDLAAIENMMKEFTAKQLKKEKQGERPSVLEKLKKFKEIVAKQPRKDKEKKKEQAR